MKIYCDASFNEKSQTAGIGLYVVDGVKRKVISNWVKCRIVNEAELFAIYVGAILSGGKPCTLYSDSMNALSYIRGERGMEYEKKKKNVWTREQYFNHKKMRVLAYQIKRVNPNISFEWIKGHRNVLQRESIANNMADLLAKNGISDYLGK